MSEKLKPISSENWRTPWSICLWEIMVRESKGFTDTDAKSDMEQKFNIPPREKGQELEVEVELKINGVPVSFEKSLNEMWGRVMKNLDEHVRNKAKELLHHSRLNRLQEIIERAECQIEEEIETLYNETRK